MTNMAIIKETMLTLCYELALKAFQLFAASRRYAVPYNLGML